MKRVDSRTRFPIGMSVEVQWFDAKGNTIHCRGIVKGYEATMPIVTIMETGTDHVIPSPLLTPLGTPTVEEGITTKRVPPEDPSKKDPKIELEDHSGKRSPTLEELFRWMQQQMDDLKNDT